jgi:hypothetical protein
MSHVAGTTRPWYVKLAAKIGSFAIATQAAAAAGILSSALGPLAIGLGLAAIGLGLFAMLELRLWVDFHWPEPPGD